MECSFFGSCKLGAEGCTLSSTGHQKCFALCEMCQLIALMSATSAVKIALSFGNRLIPDEDSSEQHTGKLSFLLFARERQGRMSGRSGGRGGGAFSLSIALRLPTRPSAWFSGRHVAQLEAELDVPNDTQLRA